MSHKLHILSSRLIFSSINHIHIQMTCLSSLNQIGPIFRKLVLFYFHFTYIVYIIVKTKVLLPQAKVTQVDIGCPICALWFYSSQILLNYFSFKLPTLSVTDEGYFILEACRAQ